MTDLVKPIQQLVQGSSIVRVYPQASYEILESGTSNVVVSGVADDDGIITVQTLASGVYDLRVDNTIIETFQHITYDYASKFARPFDWFISGSISSDSGGANDIKVYRPGVAGKIKEINIVAEHVDATGDLTVHILRGTAPGTSRLAVPADSIYSHRVYPQAEQYPYSSGLVLPSPELSISADQFVTIGWDYTAGTVEGLGVYAIFKQS